MVVTSQTKIYLNKNIKNLQDHLFDIEQVENEGTTLWFYINSSCFIIVLCYAYSILCMWNLSFSLLIQNCFNGTYL